MPFESTPQTHVTPIRLGDALQINGSWVVGDFQPAGDYGVGVKRVDPLATADGTPFSFSMLETSGEWDVNDYDSTHFIDGVDPNFVNLGGVPTLYLDDTLLPNAGEYYLIGIFEKDMSDDPDMTVDWQLVYREPDAYPIFDSASAEVDQGTLEAALALAGHNIKFRVVNLSNGQPSTAKLVFFNTGLTDLSVNPDDLDSDSGAYNELDVDILIDHNGDEVETTSG